MATCRNGVILWTLIHTLTGQWWALHWCSSLQLTDIRVKPTGELPGYHHCVHGHCLYHIYKGQPFYLMQTKILEPHHNILSICLVYDCMWMRVCMKVREFVDCVHSVCEWMEDHNGNKVYMTLYIVTFNWLIYWETFIKKMLLSL